MGLLNSSIVTNISLNQLFLLICAFVYKLKKSATYMNTDIRYVTYVYLTYIVDLIYVGI